LRLDETAINDARLESLHHCQALESLTLSGTRTTHAGVERLRKALPNLTVYDADDKEWPPLIETNKTTAP